MKKLQELGRVIRTISVPARLQIFLLLKRKDMTLKEFSRLMSPPMKKAAVSSHLKSLSKGGFIKSSKIGGTVYYSLSTQKVKQIAKALLTLVNGVGSDRPHH